MGRVTPAPGFVDPFLTSSRHVGQVLGMVNSGWRILRVRQKRPREVRGRTWQFDPTTKKTRGGRRGVETTLQIQSPAPGAWELNLQ
jgi:hypothetical protein